MSWTATEFSAMDETVEKQLRKAVAGCKRTVMRNAPFEELASQLDFISRQSDDRVLNAEIKRLRLATKHVIEAKTERTRRRYLELLVGFARRLPEAIRAAREQA